MNGKKFHHIFQGRISRITNEFAGGFKFVANFKKTVAIFGSTRSLPSDHYYQKARELGDILTKAGFTVVTGGGSGIMEAANRGAFEAGGESVGLNIKLAKRQAINKYVTKSISFQHFFTRKVMFSFAANVYVFFPGGFGTLDEFFEMIMLVQTKELHKPVLIIAVGKEYWQPLFSWLENEVYKKRKAIAAKDLKIFHLVDSVKEALELIKNK
ncbi:MAG: TIGR00730 family Rossman fold protein [bacterium]|nr:TIGR00730 family Rossman fold protein [bacterium]